MRLIIFDAETIYADNLHNRLCACLADVSVSTCCGQDLHEIIEQNRSGPVLCLYNPRDFPDLPEKLSSCETGATWTLWRLLPGNLPPEEDSASFCRLHISAILKAIESWLTENSRELINKPSAVKQDRKAEALELWLFFSLDRNRQNSLVRDKLRQKLKSGYRTIYLALMPTYCMDLVIHPDSGPGMSDLLLQLLGSNLTADQIPRYWQPHPDGYLQFRPPDRSDDLVTCEPDMLRRMIRMLQQHLQADSQRAAVIIDCRSVPMLTVRTIAVLCSHCLVEMPDGSNFAIKAGQREINLILAELPDSCQVSSKVDLSAPKEIKPDEGIAHVS